MLKNYRDRRALWPARVGLCEHDIVWSYHRKNETRNPQGTHDIGNDWKGINWAKPRISCTWPFEEKRGGGQRVASTQYG